MRTFLATSAAALAAVLFCASAHAEGERDFCKQYKAIVTDAANGFEGFRGERTKRQKATVPPFGTIDFYAAKSWPDGALNCHIEMRDEATEDGHQYPNYYCEFPMLASDKGKALKKLATRIAACTPGASKPAGPGLDAQGGMLAWHSKNSDVHFSGFAGPSNPNVRILVQAEHR